MALGNYLSQFYNSIFGNKNSLGQSTNNAAQNFTNQINTKPSTIMVTKGDVSQLNSKLLGQIAQYGTNFAVNTNATGNPFMGALITGAQALHSSGAGGAGTLHTSNTQNNGSLYGTLGTSDTPTVNFSGSQTPVDQTQQYSSVTQTPSSADTNPTFDFNQLQRLDLQNQTTPEGLQYLNSLNNYQTQLMNFQSQNDTEHNRELAQINAEMQNVKNKQEQENRYRVEALAQSGIATGLAFEAPQLYQSVIKNTIDTGLSKIADITVKQNGLILEADKASLAGKREILKQLQQLQTEKLNTTRQMRQDFITQKEFEDAQIQKQIENNLPAIYDQVQKLPLEQQNGFIVQAAQQMGVPITQLTSSLRTFRENENSSIRDMYQKIADTVAKDNPQLALDIVQKSLTPEGRQQLMNSPYFKALSALGSVSSLFGPTDASSVVDRLAAIESSNGKNIINPDKNGINSVFQYQRGTWADYSRQWNRAVNGIDASIPESEIQKYERQVTGYIVNKWMTEGDGVIKRPLSAEEVAAKWNGAHIANGMYVANNPDYIRKFSQAGGSSSSVPNLTSIANSLATNLYGTDPKKASAFAQSIITSSTPLQVIDGAISDELIKRKATTNFSDVDSAISNITNINDLLSQYYANGGQTGWLSGSYQNFINKVGKTNNPALIGVATSINQAIQAYRKAITGVAFGEKENQDIKSIFPGIDKDKVLNDAILGARLSDLKKQKVNLASQVIGSTLANQLYGNTSTNTGSSSTTFISNSGKSYKLPY